MNAWVTSSPNPQDTASNKRLDFLPALDVAGTVSHTRPGAAMTRQHSERVEQVLADQRRRNAEVLALACGVVGCLGVVALALLPMPAKGSIIAITGLGALGQVLSYFVVRKVGVVPGVLLLIVVSMVQHVSIIALPRTHAALPFFAAVYVLVAATCLPLRWLGSAFAVVALALVGEWMAARHRGVSPEELQLSFVPALVLQCFIGVVAWIAVAGMERGFRLAHEREETHRKLVARVELQSRMEALGQMAVSVAHDFNNFLAVVLASADLAQMHLGSDHPANAELEQVRNAVTRAAQLAHELLAFGRRQVAPTGVARPGAMLHELSPILARLVGDKLELRIPKTNEDVSVIASPTQVEQIVMNLVANARDATPAGGSIAIDLSVRHVSDDAGGALSSGEYLVISVQDTGSGMDEATKRNLFEPFFTTKPAGKGTGLGLSTCQRIVTQLGGAIEVESTPGNGSTFQVWLPTAERQSPTWNRVSSESRQRVAALVVDADTEVGTLVGRLLESTGAKVVLAQDGSSALRLAQSQANLDLIVSELTLGTGSGLPLLASLAGLHPRARLVLMSSTPPDEVIGKLMRQSGADFLRKPFSAAQVIELARS